MYCLCLNDNMFCYLSSAIKVAILGYAWTCINSDWKQHCANISKLVNKLHSLVLGLILFIKLKKPALSDRSLPWNNVWYYIIYNNYKYNFTLTIYICFKQHSIIIVCAHCSYKCCKKCSLANCRVSIKDNAIGWDNFTLKVASQGQYYSTTLEWK